MVHGGDTITSGVWGNQPETVTQGFDERAPGVPADWYAYSADWGLPYGMHAGLDIGVPKMTPIYAAEAGVVEQAGMNDYFRPQPVMVDTPDNRQDIYGHLWQDTVSAGQAVQKGQLLGYSGEQTYPGTMTPDGSGPHLHFEERDLNKHVVLDPWPLLTGTQASDGTGGATIDPAKIDAEIAKAEQSNGHASPLHGKGETFVSMGEKYGINPAVAVAISMRECQLGAAANDVLVPLNNFGGNTAIPGQVEGTAGYAWRIDRNWQVNATVDDGIEGIFKTLNGPQYRATGGQLQAVMNLYSPPSENDWASMWAIFAQVGGDLGVTLGPDTNIYGPASGGGTNAGGTLTAAVASLTHSAGEGAKRVGLGILGVSILAIGLIVIVSPLGADIARVARKVPVPV